jgi:hypothetical protein
VCVGGWLCLRSLESRLRAWNEGIMFELTGIMFELTELIMAQATTQPIVTGSSIIGIKYAGGVMVDRISCKHLIFFCHIYNEIYALKLASDCLCSYGSLARYNGPTSPIFPCLPHPHVPSLPVCLHSILFSCFLSNNQALVACGTSAITH